MLKVNRRFLLDFDWMFLLLSLAIASCGLVGIYSVGPEGLWQKQIIFIFLGLALMFITLSWDYHKIIRYAAVIYGITIVLNLIVLAFAREVNGARAWLDFGPFKFQPSELAKIATILMLTAFLARQKKEGGAPLTFKEILIGGGIVGLPVLVIMAQDDLGTALTFFPILFVIFFLSGLRWYLVVGGILIAVVGVVGAYKYALGDYQRQRINAIIKPETVDPRGYGYHTIQSKIAVGSGGMFGKGLKHGTQSQLRFLPFPHTDFIMAAFGEETGFFGTMLVLSLILFWLMRAMSIAQLSRDRIGMLMIMGIVALFFGHIMTNIGMAVGWVPVLGIPLPLMSYGGSSILATFIAIGLILNVRLRRFVN